MHQVYVHIVALQANEYLQLILRRYRGVDNAFLGITAHISRDYLVTLKLCLVNKEYSSIVGECPKL